MHSDYRFKLVKFSFNSARYLAKYQIENIKNASKLAFFETGYSLLFSFGRFLPQNLLHSFNVNFHNFSNRFNINTFVE